MTHLLLERIVYLFLRCNHMRDICITNIIIFVLYWHVIVYIYI